MEEEFEEALKEMETLIASTRSAILGSVGSQGDPLASYAPVWMDSQRRFYVYISSMAKHTSQLRRSGKASAMLIEDEAMADNLFARKRLTADCSVRLIKRDTPEWDEVIGKMVERLGDTMNSLKGLIDFDLFCLAPSEGRLVLGFGRSYRVSGEALSEIGYVGGPGHRSK